MGVSTATVQRAFSWPPPENQAEYVSRVRHAGIHTFSLQQEEVKATVSRWQPSTCDTSGCHRHSLVQALSAALRFLPG